LGRRPSRRDFIKVVIATPAALAAACSGGAGAGPDGSTGPDGAVPGADGAPPPDAAPVVPPEGVPESADFPLGVSSGDAATDSIVLWCQYTGTATLGVTVWLMDGDSYAAELGSYAATPADGGFVHVEVDGLAPGARYRYAFFELGETSEAVARSGIGRFRAAIAEGSMEPLVIGAVACTDRSRGYEALARAAERTDLDLFLFVGDNAYCDGADGLDDYRGLYVEHYGKPEHVALRAATSLLATWDDHEVENDFDPEDIAPEKLAIATQSFFEHLPLRRIEDAPDRIWRSVRWGRTAEIFVLDCRSERKPSTRTDDVPIYISRAQMDWLKQALVDSDAVFKIIVNSVPITNMPTVWDVWPVDRWEGYPAARTEILAHIDDAEIGGVLWVAGDFHLGFVAQVGTGDGPGAGQLEVAVGPGAQSPNPLTFSLQPPQFAFGTGTNNVTTFHLDPALGRVRVVFTDGEGTAIHDAGYDL
jgi:alkaline phosphatase D